VGNTSLDDDNDGIPCENLCKTTEQFRKELLSIHKEATMDILKSYIN